MIKLLICDLDGVIITSPNAHYISLNQALKDFNLPPISEEAHKATYNGLPTRIKLNMLGVDPALHVAINERKQAYSSKYFMETVTRDEKLISIFTYLTLNTKECGYKIHVASNSMMKTIEIILLKKEILHFVSHIESNESVQFPKPNPAMYLKCMIHAGVGPSETLIIEDSPVGIAAAKASGATVMEVSGPEQVTLDNIKRFL